MKYSEMKALLREDLQQVHRFSADFSGSPVRWTRQLSNIATPTVIACSFYRVSHYLYTRRWRRLSFLVAAMNYAIHKCWIAPGCQIGPGLYIPHTVGVVMHGHAGRGLVLYSQAVVCPEHPVVGRIDVGSDSPVLEDDVIVGARGVVKGAVRIGARSIIGLGGAIATDMESKSVLVPTSSRMVEKEEYAGALSSTSS